MICLESPKSSELQNKKYTNSGQNSLTMFISSVVTTINLIF